MAFWTEGQTQHGSPGHTLFLQPCHDIQEKGEEKPTVGGAGAPSPPPGDSRHRALAGSIWQTQC